MFFGRATESSTNFVKFSLEDNLTWCGPRLLADVGLKGLGFDSSVLRHAVFL